MNKGRILEERGDLEDALEAYDKLIEMNPRDADAWVAQGDVLGKMGREDDALKSYQEAVRIAPSDEDTQGKVTGMVAAQNVIVRGKVSGVVCGKTVALQASSHVEGDVHHMSLAIEQGAMFEGRSRRATDESALSSVVEGKGEAQPAWQASS